VFLRSNSDGPAVELESHLEGRYLMRVLTPCGDLLQPFENPQGKLRLTAELAAEYLRLVSDLPLGMPVVIRVESSLGTAKSAWKMLRIGE
jgi:hypothetical protein